MVEGVIWPAINKTKSTCPVGPSVSCYQVSIGWEINMTLSCFYSSLILFHPQVPMSVGINLTIEYFRNELLRSRHSQRNFHAPELIRVWSSNWPYLFADLLHTHVHPVFFVKWLEQTATFPCTRLPQWPVSNGFANFASRLSKMTGLNHAWFACPIPSGRSHKDIHNTSGKWPINVAHLAKPSSWGHPVLLMGLSHPDRTFTSRQDFHIQTTD